MSHPFPSASQRFEQALSLPEPDWDAALALLPDLEKGGEAEKAYALLRHQRLPKGPHPAKFTQLKIRLGVASEKARERRAFESKLDSDRGILRLRYGRGKELAHLNPAQFLAFLTVALRGAGLDPVMSLEKTPRPLVALGHPLPIGIPGHSEWADTELSPMPKHDESALLGRLNHAAPEGLSFKGCAALPAYATPVLELSRLAHWSWSCPSELRSRALASLSVFELAENFTIEKMGKEGGRKLAKRIEVRPMVASFFWEDKTLHLTTRISAKDTLNPLKLLAGILGLEPSIIRGIERTSVELSEDPRISQAERFEPKLRNIYEDAVLLSSGPSLRVIDEDEDEPLKLG